MVASAAKAGLHEFLRIKNVWVNLAKGRRPIHSLQDPVKRVERAARHKPNYWQVPRPNHPRILSSWREISCSPNVDSVPPSTLGSRFLISISGASTPIRPHAS